MEAANWVCQACGTSAEGGQYCGRCGGQLGPAPEDDLVGTQLGPYKVAGILGEGGMGRVYKGVHPSIGSRVAIKVLSASCADKPALVDRFFAEARAVNLIRHESIVNVLDLSKLPDGRPFIVMEYLDGAPLSSVIENVRKFPLGSAARLATEVLGALAAAHQKGIIHRDLKPDNIFVSPQGRAKVLDFGIAKLLPEAAGAATPTQTGALLGTPHYMSPEQALAKKVDHRADIYSMGLILYECCTGRRAFDAESLYELLHLQVHTQPPPPKQLRPDLPDAYQNVILTALAKDPAHRFQNAEHFIHALGEACSTLGGDAWQPIGTQVDAASSRMAAMSTPTTGSRGKIPSGADTARDTPLVAPQGAGPHQVTAVPGARGTGEGARPAAKKGRGLVLGAAALAVLLVGGVTASVVATSTDETNDPVQEDPTAELPTTENQNGETPTTENQNGETPTTENQNGETPTTENAEAPTPNPKKPKDREPKKPKKPKDKLQIAEADPSPPPKPKVKKPRKPKLTRIPIGGVNLSNFDVDRFFPRAQGYARQILPDAKFFRLDADGIQSNGKANLKLQSNFSVLYRFMSPSAAKKPKNHPPGLDFKPSCMIYVVIQSSGSQAYLLDGWECKDSPQRKPRCTFKQAWDWAIKEMGAPANGIASISYYGFKGGRAKVRFSIKGTKLSGETPPVCR